MDAILYWNEVALDANKVSHSRPGNKPDEQRGPTLSARALAIVHLALYDAFAGVVNDPTKLPAYLPALPAAPAGADLETVVGAAAVAALKALYPSQSATFEAKYSARGLSPDPANASRVYGEQVAAATLADRAADPDASSVGYSASNARGHHRPDPDNAGQGFYAPYFGARSKLFAATKRHSLLAPPQPGELPYLNALVDVIGNGIKPELAGTLPASYDRRTAEETLIGLFWGYDGARDLGTPPRLYNQIVRKVAEDKGNSPIMNARLFALVNVAMADAGILAWEQKYIHDLWRPVVAIREHDTSMGPTGGDCTPFNKNCYPEWLPLGAPASNALKPSTGTGGETAEQLAGAPARNFTPPFPAYPSGHATFGAAALHITRLFYGVTEYKDDNLLKDLQFVSEELNGETQNNLGTVRPRHARCFKGGLWQMILENARSRVYLGVHWQFDAYAVDGLGNALPKVQLGGVPLGLTIAEDIFKHKMAKSTVGPAI